MHQNYQREYQGNAHHRISLPKTGIYQLQSTSTRCISVNKHDNKPTLLNTSLPNKTTTQPKQLSVNLFIVSTSLGKATTMNLSEEYFPAGPYGMSPKIAPLLL